MAMEAGLARTSPTSKHSTMAGVLGLCSQMRRLALVAVATAGCQGQEAPSSVMTRSVADLKQAVCEAHEDPEWWHVGPVVVTAPRSRRAGDVAGRFAVQDLGGGGGTGLWVESTEGTLVENLGLEVGDVVDLSVEVTPGVLSCRALQTRLLPEGIISSGRRASPVAEAHDLDEPNWQQYYGDLVELSDLAWTSCPSCWGTFLVDQYNIGAIGGSMYQIPSVRNARAATMRGIVDLMVTNTTFYYEGLWLHPRGPADVELAEEGESCESSLSDATASSGGEWVRILDADVLDAEAYPITLDNGETSLPVYEGCVLSNPDCAGPRTQGAIDATGYRSKAALTAWGEWWCMNDHRPSVTDGLSP